MPPVDPADAPGRDAAGEAARLARAVARLAIATGAADGGTGAVARLPGERRRTLVVSAELPRPALGGAGSRADAAIRGLLAQGDDVHLAVLDHRVREGGAVARGLAAAYPALGRIVVHPDPERGPDDRPDPGVDGFVDRLGRRLGVGPHPADGGIPPSFKHTVRRLLRTVEPDAVLVVGDPRLAAAVPPDAVGIVEVLAPGDARAPRAFLPDGSAGAGGAKRPGHLDRPVPGATVPPPPTAAPVEAGSSPASDLDRGMGRRDAAEATPGDALRAFLGRLAPGATLVVLDGLGERGVRRGGAGPEEPPAVPGQRRRERAEAVAGREVVVLPCDGRALSLDGCATIARRFLDTGRVDGARRAGAILAVCPAPAEAEIEGLRRSLGARADGRVLFVDEALRPYFGG